MYSGRTISRMINPPKPSGSKTKRSANKGNSVKAGAIPKPRFKPGYTKYKSATTGWPL